MLRKELSRFESGFEALAEPVRATLLDLGLRTPTQPQALAIPRIIQRKNVLLESMQDLTEEEIMALSRASRAADLVLSYGRRAVTALLTWGVGPQTAASILAKMHTQDENFYADLLKAKLKYIQTRPYWD